MRIVDANSGAEVVVGEVFRNIDGEFKLVRVDEHLMSGRVLLERSDGDRVWVPLTVRYLHPNFLLQKTGFIPS